MALTPCFHPHLKFKNQGAALACVDCPRAYHILMPQIGALFGGIPDVGYNHPQLSEIEGRHAPYASPRLLPLPRPRAKPEAPKPVQAPPAQRIKPDVRAHDPVPRSSAKARRLLRGKKK